jgi:hypothetical protein
MRLITWCEAEWKGDCWEIRKITEHFPNLFQRLVLRQKPRTEIQRFQKRCTNRDDMWNDNWSVLRNSTDESDRQVIYNESLVAELNKRINDVRYHGSFEDLINGSTATVDQHEKTTSMAAAAAATSPTPGFLKYLASLEDLKVERAKLKAQLDAEMAKAERDAKRMRPRTLSEFLTAAGVREVERPPHIVALEATVVAEAEKIKALHRAMNS